MFEFTLKNLQVGDEFTDNNGETWHVVKSIHTASGAMYHVVCTDGYEFERAFFWTVIVK